MSRLGLRLLVAVSIMAAALPLTAEAQPDEDPPPVLREPGTYSLLELAGGGVTLQAGEGMVFDQWPYHRSVVGAQYRLPEDAQQGPDTWYVLHYHFEVIFRDDAAQGEATIYAAATEAIAGIGAMIGTELSTADGSPEVTWSSLGLTEGRQWGTVRSRRVEIFFSNYLPYRGVKPGDNVLFFSVKEPDGPIIETFRVFEDTAIQITPLSPPKLEVDTTQSYAMLLKDGTVEVGYAIRNAGGWPAADITAEVVFPEESLRPVGEATATVDRLEGGESYRGTFLLEPLTAPPYQLSIAVGGRTGGGTEAQITHLLAVTEPVSWYRRWGLVAGVALLSTVPLLPFRRIATLLRTAPRARRRGAAQ